MGILHHFSASNFSGCGLKFTANSTSPLKWTETQVLSAFSPLKEDFRYKRGILNPWRIEQRSARSELYIVWLFYQVIRILERAVLPLQKALQQMFKGDVYKVKGG